MLSGDLGQLSLWLPILGLRSTTRERRTEAAWIQAHKFTADVLEVVPHSVPA